MKTASAEFYDSKWPNKGKIRLLSFRWSWRASIESDKQRARQDDLDFKAMIAIGLADSIKG